MLPTLRRGMSFSLPSAHVGSTLKNFLPPIQVGMALVKERREAEVLAWRHLGEAVQVEGGRGGNWEGREK